jgi:DNA modification methylase
MLKKMAAVQCTLRRKVDSRGHELRRSARLNNQLSTPIYITGSKRRKSWDILKEKGSLSLRVSFEGETVNDFNAVNVKDSKTYLEASLQRLGFDLCSFIAWKRRSHFRNFRATTVIVTRDAISKYLIESPWPVCPEVSFKRILVNSNASVEDVIDTEKIVLKFYNVFLLEEAFTNGGEIYHDSVDEYIEACYKKLYKGEIDCLRKIADFNKSSEEQGLDSRINAP